MTRHLEYLDARGESLEERISYTNSKGETWTNTVEEIFTQGFVP